MLTQFQEQKLTNFFNVLDANKDGTLEKADLDRLASKIGAVRNWTPGEPSYAALQGMYDGLWAAMGPFVEGSQLSRPKFIAFYDAVISNAAVYATAVTALAGFLFETLDADGDGKVTPAELRALYGAYGIDLALVGDMFKRFDKNCDGFLARDEVASLVDEFFRSQDRDAPGNWLFGPC